MSFEAMYLFSVAVPFSFVVLWSVTIKVGLLLFIGVCILNNLRQLVEYYFSQGLIKPVLTIPSFFATLKKEKLYQMNTRTMTKAEVRSVVYRYIHYYNLRRIYSTNDGWPPTVYRRMYFEQFEVAC